MLFDITFQWVAIVTHLEVKAWLELSESQGRLLGEYL